VDHFSYTNNDTFAQRIIVSVDHWCGNKCPIFFYTGNEGDIFMFANNTGFMWENAPEFGAMIVFAEHRYYGESLPYGNKAFEVSSNFCIQILIMKIKNLQTLGYLTAEQAMADFATNIQHIKRTGAEQSPVIVFGGSYGGMLSAWFRMKYPHLAEGALAASAPLFQFPHIYKCHQFYEIITKDFEEYSKECAQSIRNSWDAIKNIGSSESGLSWLSDTFHLCKPLQTGDIKNFISWLVSTYENLAMVDYPNPSNFLAPLPAYPINATCSHLKNPNQAEKPLLRQLYKAISVFYNYTGQAKCNDISGDVASLGTKGWDFQSCTEMVMPVCSDGVQDMFFHRPWNITQVKIDCLKQWKVLPEPFKAELIFGGKNISAASNIIFSNGDRDPWSAGGVLHSLSESLIYIGIPHACHHEDLRPAGPNDPPSLIQARQKEIKIIKRWVIDYYERIGYFPAL
ncbi:lysosomal Pro-X carboxypeptidase-like protein, partial [Dinothrombium tinctorium]